MGFVRRKKKVVIPSEEPKVVHKMKTVRVDSKTEIIVREDIPDQEAIERFLSRTGYGIRKALQIDISTAGEVIPEIFEQAQKAAKKEGVEIIETSTPEEIPDEEDED